MTEMEILKELGEMGLEVKMKNGFTDMQYWYASVDGGRWYEEYTLLEALKNCLIEAHAKYGKAGESAMSG